MPLKPKYSSEPFFARYDSREDLGYGRVTPKFHKPRQLADQFPYAPEDNLENTSWEDEETHDAIDKKTVNFYKTDPFSIKGTNPFYFAAGNVKLSDCFYRTDQVLEEVFALSNSISPVPMSKKSMRRAGTGASVNSKSFGQKSYKRTGSRKGFASAPPDLKYDKNVNHDLDAIFNLDDLATKLDHESGNFKL